jgi:putative transposase
MSERRACRVIGTDRTSIRYAPKRADDSELRDRLKALAQERRRFGYRRLHVLLRREGHEVNRKRVQRIYREEKLMVRKRGGRKRALGTRRPIETPVRPNERWSLDFVSDQLTDGRRFRMLAVVDDCTRESLCLIADTSLSGLRVARELDALIAERGKPSTIVSDNGPSSRQTPSCPGPTDRVSAGTTSRPASRCRTASWRASTAGSGMSFSTIPCSTPCRTRQPS